MRIAVCDTLGSEEKFQRYVSWLAQHGDQCVRISYRLQNLRELDSCSALVLTGGHDVDPLLYGGPAHHPAIADVDRLRDDFERAALDAALRRDIPLLGICRGLQLANVHLGGTLIPDIEEAGYPPHTSSPEGVECRHGVVTFGGSLLPSPDLRQRQERQAGGIVNSSHHQAVDKPAAGLSVIARSSADGIIEALGREKSGDHPFFLLVQWHPERMLDAGNPLAGGILERFLSSVQHATTQSTGNEK